MNGGAANRDVTCAPIPCEGAGARAAASRAHELLEQVGPDADKVAPTPRRLSGDSSSRVAIARRAAHGPQLSVRTSPPSSRDPELVAKGSPRCSRWRAMMTMIVASQGEMGFAR